MDDENVPEVSEVENVPGETAAEVPDVVPEVVTPVEDAIIFDPPLQYMKAPTTRHGVILGDVRPGQQSEDSYLLVRSMGGDDGGKYTLALVEAVRERMRTVWGDEVDRWDGVVNAGVWGVILRDVRLGDSGHEVSVLRSLAGLSPGGTYDSDLAEVLGTKKVGRDTWIKVLTAP